MYRGLPPRGQLLELSPEDQMSLIASRRVKGGGWRELFCFCIPKKPKVEACDVVFSIKPGDFYDCIMPETVASLWGPVPLERLPPGVDNTCRAVTHDIVNGLGEKKMSVHLVHSLPLVLSAVQVFAGSEMAVVGHTVGPDTVGQITQLELDTTFKGVPWRAFLIKAEMTIPYLKCSRKLHLNFEIVGDFWGILGSLMRKLGFLAVQRGTKIGF